MTFSGGFGRVFRPVFDPGLTARNGLLNALIAYWPGNEASGGAQDVHTNALHLTDTNTVTNAAGKVYATARQYTQANSEYHVRSGDDALLSAGDADLTLAAWVYFDNLTAARGIAGKAATSQAEYALVYSAATSRLRWIISPNGTAAVNTNAEDLGAPSTGVWYLMVGWHDSVANTVSIQVNNGTVNSQAHSAGVHNGSAAFRIGEYFANYMDGRIGPTAFWKSAAGGGGVLSSSQRTSLWNAGAGLAYANFTT